MDHQVKIRGFRVELGEIESSLNRHPAIRESVVIAADGPDGAKRLVAYHVPRSGDDGVDLNAVREFLGKTLPDYMVPSAFVLLKELPLTSNGKVDRRALPAPDNAEAANGANHVPPRTATEAALVEIWCNVLGRKSVSIHENFFHLGGHSLLATQVIWRITGTFNVDLPVRTIFEAPTIEALAEAISRAQPNDTPGLARRARGTTGSGGLMGRLDQLSDEDLQRLLRNPKLKDMLDESSR
jgi:acyl carrier protein